MEPTMSKKPVVHIKKFAGGRETPQEMHRRLGIRKNCALCGHPAAIRIKVFAPLAELIKRTPEYVAGICASNPDGPYVPTIDTTYGKMVKISDVGACDLCKTQAEKEAAKGPSWMLVEIDRGPGNTVAVQVPAGLRG